MDTSIIHFSQGLQWGRVAKARATEGGMSMMGLTREEMLACIIALEKEKPYQWRNSALLKILKVMNMKPKEG